MMKPQLACVPLRERVPDWEWMRSKRRAENPGIRKKEDELRLDSWIQIRSTEWDERKCSNSVFLTQRLPAFHRRTLKEVRGEEKPGGIERQPGARNGGEGAEGEKTEWAEGGKRFEGEGGVGVLH